SGAATRCLPGPAWLVPSNDCNLRVPDLFEETDASPRTVRDSPRAVWQQCDETHAPRQSSERGRGVQERANLYRLPSGALEECGTFVGRELERRARMAKILAHG